MQKQLLHQLEHHHQYHLGGRILTHQISYLKFFFSQNHKPNQLERIKPALTKKTVCIIDNDVLEDTRMKEIEKKEAKKLRK